MINSKKAKKSASEFFFLFERYLKNKKILDNFVAQNTRRDVMKHYLKHIEIFKVKPNGLEASKCFAWYAFLYIKNLNEKTSREIALILDGAFACMQDYIQQENSAFIFESDLRSKVRAMCFHEIKENTPFGLGMNGLYLFLKHFEPVHAKF